MKRISNGTFYKASIKPRAPYNKNLWDRTNYKVKYSILFHNFFDLLKLFNRNEFFLYLKPSPETLATIKSQIKKQTHE